MFSVEDLLFSHGYKVSKNSVSSCQSEGYQQETTDIRAGNGMLNGYQADPEVFAADPYPHAKSYFSDSEKNCVNRSRQISSAGHPRSQRCLDACHTSETGLSQRPQNERLQWVKTDKEIQHWRRRGRDFGILLGDGNSEEGDDKIKTSPNKEAKQMCNILDKNVTEPGSDVVESLEMVRTNVAFENWKPSLEERWEKINKSAMKDTKTSERTMSESSADKLLQNFSISQVDNALVCPNKLKSLSISKGLSPDNVSHVSLPTAKGENYMLKEDKTQLQSDWVENVDSNSNLYAKVTYSRPSKPPSYEVYQQTWGAGESSESPDNQKEEYLPTSREQDQPQGSCFQDTGLEPPNYIPPPSYKSPPLHTTNQSLYKVPNIHLYNRPNNPVAKANAHDKSPTSSLESDILYNSPTDLRHTDNYHHSVQYIPFNDPRVKHVTSKHEAEKKRHRKHANNKNDAFRVAHTNREGHVQERESAFIDFKSAKHIYGKREGIKHKQWISIPGQICCSLPETREGSTACSLPENSDTSHRLTLKKTHSDSACETVTKVRKFEPEACIHNRRSSKRKLNETIFCLVSIPIKSDSSEMCNNNKNITDRMNMLKHSNGGLFDQRLLSASSSDQELQTLTGNMNNKAELLKQDQSKLEDNEQANDLRSVDPRKHRELGYTGSWPGDQYKDQQTQTVFTDIQNTKPCNGTQTSESQCGSANGLEKPRLPSESARQNVFSIKGQMSLSPSSNSAFSRTSSAITHISKTEPCQRLEIYNEKAAGKCEKNETETGKFCNQKEVFGQFLLKPVNRRPWDAISELESLNKEFQGQENRSNDGDGNVVKEQGNESPMDISAMRNAIRKEMVANTRHVIEVEEVPLFEPSQVKCLSESRCSDMLVCENPKVNVEKIKENRIKPEKLADGCLRSKKQVQNKKTGTTTDPPTYVDQPVQIKSSKVQTEINFHPSQGCFSVFRVDKPQMDHLESSANCGQVGDKAIKKISLKNRSNGFSVPDLSKHFLTVHHNGESPEQLNNMDIPENESLHDRAVRILGIDVADDCLVSTGSSEAQSPESFILSANVQNEGKGRISEMEVILKEVREKYSGSLQSHSDSEKENLTETRNQPTSQLGENGSTQNSEKRVRNTSKMIETLQGKLASTPPRTAVDRLARMKEVDSVSRMRRLSIKSTDSGEDIDEEKHMFRVQDFGSHKFSAGAIYKRVISLDESLLITTKNREKLDLSFAGKNH
ncbi:hypothetical protein GDO86_011929 [Hymenochirus boettgeri]|uniref:Uncharacterized protein n=1 Tax=Hymenochirus boettgeri TaxID=247094 RepID=A0A8T2JJ32_9PIPI|nr:hypothetical protein GDO86_011929 [Hymenochirus boettgeri]